MTEPVPLTCLTCGIGETLRVIRPRIACTASTFGNPEVRCMACCRKTRGMFKLCRMTLSDYSAHISTRP